MPILGSSSVVQFTINDLIPEVLVKVENKTLETSRAAIWLRDAILDIASNIDYRDEFSELELFGPTFNLTGGPSGIGVQEYPETNIVPQGTINDATLDILIWIDFPTNTVRRKLEPTHFQDSDKIQTNSPSLPTQWYRFANNIGFTPVPDKNYQIQSRVLQQHPINDNNLPATVILLPRDWNLILVYAAASIGFAELLEYEKSQNIVALLHGDPKDPAKPGLIKSRKRKREREAWRTERSLRPIYRGYGWGMRR